MSELHELAQVQVYIYRHFLLLQIIHNNLCVHVRVCCQFVMNILIDIMYMCIYENLWFFRVKGLPLLSIY